MSARNHRRTTTAVPNKIGKQKLPRVLPLAPRLLKDQVVTIGYKTAGVLNGSALKESFDDLKARLGGKGAGLVSMAKIKIPVPPAFNLGTAVCSFFMQSQNIPEPVLRQAKTAMQGLEKTLGKKFGSKENPLLVSVRSGAKVSMPGMMDTILNLGLNLEITQNLADLYPERARFWWDCYRRLIQMFGDVVLQIEHSVFENILSSWKQKEGVKSDAELSVEALQQICRSSERQIADSGKIFPHDPWEQLHLAMKAVFRSWNTDRAIHYRKLNGIPEDAGTAVTIQAMVFGNLNSESGTGVVFTRDPSTGEKKLYGEYLVNAQGEDVVAGIRTPEPIAEMKKEFPKAYRALEDSLQNLEDHFNEVQDVEFTIEDGRLFILQTRNAKRSAAATLEHLYQFVREKRLKPEEAILRITYDQVKQLLHPTLKPTSETPIVRGLAASPGAVSGRVAFDPETALSFSRAQQKVILVRRETSPEDIMGMAVSEGILTATGGMTSHAAVVGRGMGKACVVGCSDLNVDEEKRKGEAGGKIIAEGDLITLNGSTGDVYLGELATQPVTWGETAQKFFKWADEKSEIPVLANADTPDQARLARELGAQGIGLCRTEHMFFDKERIHHFRLMILSEGTEKRGEIADQLATYQKTDFVGIFKEMQDLSVCVRLLDPPLHEFLPHREDIEEIRSLASELQYPEERILQRIDYLHEVNPMLGHRGCRLGITFPEIYDMQVRALADALMETCQAGRKLKLKIMLPLIMNLEELRYLLDRLKKVFDERVEEANLPKKINLEAWVQWGTMIELPRACVQTGEFSPHIDFVSFGTNDLTQTTLGISRDDAGKFIPAYVEKHLLAVDPFETLDTQGVGRLVEISVTEGRRQNPKLQVGICGEHGGDPSSIEFFHRLGFDSVSCSPFRVPIARLATAKAQLNSKTLAKKKRRS